MVHYDYRFDPLEVTETNQTIEMNEASESPCYLKFVVEPSLKRWNMTYSRQIKLEITLESVNRKDCPSSGSNNDGNDGTESSSRRLSDENTGKVLLISNFNP